MDHSFIVYEKHSFDNALNTPVNQKACDVSRRYG